MQGCEEVKSHPWFKNFDWEALRNKTMKPSFVPDKLKNNYDDNHVNNRGWNDTEEVQEYQHILNRASQKAVFNAYYFDKKTIAPPDERMGTDHNEAEEDMPQEDEDGS